MFFLRRQYRLGCRVSGMCFDHELRVRSELAVVVTEALERTDRLPTLPVDELARMIVAVTEGSDIQALTNRAGSAGVQSRLGPRAVRALLEHFSVPTGSAIPRKGEGSR